MKDVSLLFMLLLLVCVSACNDTPHNAMKEKPATEADVLQKEVIDAHDVAMAKMMKIEKLTEQLQSISDSIKKLPATKQKELQVYKTSVDGAIKKLGYADVAMNKWMNEFNLDSNRNDEKLRIQYLTDEKVKVNKMKEAVLSSVALADSLLIKK